MLLPFSIRVAFVKFCVCPSFPFGIEGGMWDVIVFIPDHTNKITWGGGGGGGGGGLQLVCGRPPSPFVLLWFFRHLVDRFAWKIPSS